MDGSGKTLMSEYRHGQDIQQGKLGHIVKIDVSGHNGKHDAVRGNNGEDAVGDGDKHGKPGGDGGDAEHGPEEEGAGTRGADVELRFTGQVR